jgi:TRAP-type mannitol/chloroaromatic compound transport system substrate-binding protein
MKCGRRKFLAASTAVVASSIAAPAIAQSRPQIKWRCTSSFPKSLDIIYGGAEVFSQVLSALTDGQFQIQVFAAGELVGGLQAADAVTAGTVEMAHTASFYYVGKDPTFALGGTIPFAMNSRQHNAWMHTGGGNELFNEFLAGHGIYSLPGGMTGTQMGGWFRKPINSSDDLKGVKMRIAGLAGQMMAKLGVVPQQIAGGDIFPALERGTIDAVEWVGPHDDEKLGFWKIAKNYYYPAFWEGGTMLHFFFNKAQWEQLPAQYKAAATAAARVANDTMLNSYDLRNPQALRRLIANGVELRPFPNEVMEAGYRANQELCANISSQNAAFKKIYDALIQSRNEQYLWFQIAEYSFDTFMIRNRQKR